MDTQHDYDYIIIGSGFGGSVSALRLSEKGYKVLVIEKGKWYRAEDFAKTNWNFKKWLWMPTLRLFGIMKLSFFKHVTVASGTGVGGGSLVYANTLPIPKKAFYKSGSWAALNDWENDLAPYYDRALKMLGAARNPQLFEGDRALQKMAEEMGISDQFERPNVGVHFGKPNEKVKDPYFDGKGPDRVGCNFCGGCMTGCRYNAKNTLDKNYLHLAQGLGAEIIAEREVIDIQPIDGESGATGYRVTIKSSTSLLKKKETITSTGVVCSGGVLGTIPLLLKLKKTTLPRLSDQLGDNVRTNNETLLSVSSLDKKKDFSKGVAIGSLLHTDENSHLEIVRYAEGSGFWRWSHFPLTSGKNLLVRFLKIIGLVIQKPLSYFKLYFTQSWSKSTSVLLFMQTIDSTLKLKRTGFGGVNTAVSSGVKPTPDIPESIELTKHFSKLTDGLATNFGMELLTGATSTAHILGGAVMGEDVDSGVIDKNNKVFGYENLMVVDGSMISANPGVNPSLSITAIAERAMDQVPEKVK